MMTTSRRTLLTVLLPLATVSLAACASPTEPQLSESSVARRQDLICVTRGVNGQPIVTEPVNGSCPVGFDLQPWW